MTKAERRVELEWLTPDLVRKAFRYPETGRKLRTIYQMDTTHAKRDTPRERIREMGFQVNALADEIFVSSLGIGRVKDLRSVHFEGRRLKHLLDVVKAHFLTGVSLTNFKEIAFIHSHGPNTLPLPSAYDEQRQRGDLLYLAYASLERGQRPILGIVSALWEEADSPNGLACLLVREGEKIGQMQKEEKLEFLGDFTKMYYPVCEGDSQDEAVVLLATQGYLVAPIFIPEQRILDSEKPLISDEDMEWLDSLTLQ